MEIKVIKTGSIGNCYALKNNSGQILLLDCGVPFQEIMVKLDFNINQINGCIVSHSHADHINPKTAERLMNSGIYVWKAFEDKSHTQKFIGDFRVISFDVPHDGVENRGFLIQCGEIRILYITDVEYCRHNFQMFGVDAILIECNYQSKYVDMNIDHLAHVYRGHMELQTCCGFIKANQSKHLKNVILCHLSLSNANPEECRKAAADITEATVDVAQAGMTIQIGNATKGRIENETDFY